VGASGDWWEVVGECTRPARSNSAGLDFNKFGGGWFRGVATVSLDSKNRLVVPARYRDALLVNGGGRVVITADPSQCLLLYPLPEWEPIEKKLNGLSDFNLRTRSLKQLLVSYAHDMDMDGAGRVLLPPMLRKFAELDKSLVLVGREARSSCGTRRDGKRRYRRR